MLINKETFKMKVIGALMKSKKEFDVKKAFEEELDKIYNEMNPVDIDNMTPEERRCYGSPLNKFSDSMVNQKRRLGIINIDLLIYDDNRKQFRFVEYKHGNENTSKGQRTILIELAKCLSESSSYKADVCIIRADYPFNYGIVENITKDTYRETDKNGIINYINLIE